MKRLRPHPTHAVLSRFSDGGLAPRDARRVADHLAGCPACRDALTFMRRAGDLARSLDTPVVDPSLLERALERRAAGDAVILPTADPGADRPRPTWAVSPFAALFLLFVAGVLVSVKGLHADRPGLSFTPARPAAEDTVDVEYDGRTGFQDLPSVVVRARHWTAMGPDAPGAVAVLRRHPDGIFRGRLVLPPGVVYTELAVEDPAATRVDSRNGRFWDLLVHEDGQPLPDALAARAFSARRAGDLTRMVEASVETTRRHPSAPQGWLARLLAEAVLYPADSVLQAHRQRLRQLERRFTRSPPEDPDVLAWLAGYALAAGDPVSADAWSRRAEVRGAGGVLFPVRTLLSGYRHRTRPDQHLAELEELWVRSPLPLAAAARSGWRLALELEDWDRAMIWLDRLERAPGGVDCQTILAELATAFDTARVARWGDERWDRPYRSHMGARPLDQTRASFDRRTGAADQRGLAELASLLEAAGHRDRAMERARSALTRAWETDALDRLGRVLLRGGDTAAATIAFARAAADIRAGPPPAAVAAADGWALEVAEARTALDEYLLAGTILSYPGFEGTVQRDGHRVPLLSLLDGRLALLMALPPLCDEARAVLDRARTLPVLAGPGAPRAVPVVVGVGRLPPSRIQECELPVTVYEDSRGALARALPLGGTPAFFVVDGAGRVRYHGTELNDIPRLLLALGTPVDPIHAD